MNVSELEGDVRGIYGKLIELGYTEDLTEDDIQLVVEKIQESSNWVPQGTVTANDVLEGKTFYNKSRDIQTGIYKPEEFTFLGDTLVNEVLEGRQFYSDSNELLTGTLRLPIATAVSYKGDASEGEVLFGKTFYSNSGILKTGTYTPPSVSYLGDALVTDVMSGKKFYSDTGTLLTGTWSFLGDAQVTEVMSGQKFYSNSGTLLTGTYTPPTSIDFSTFQYSTYDDNVEGDYQGEESEWSNMTVGADIVWQDERTGLYWSADRGGRTNIFTVASCDFFTSVPRSSYDGLDTDCGNAINYCATLDFAERTNWYLPSRKELMQAYIDGMYNQAGASFTNDNTYFSSSEYFLLNNYAWYVGLHHGFTGLVDKTDNHTNIRCVSRD